MRHARVGGGHFLHPSLLRLPLPMMKWRDGPIRTQNRRNQR